MNKWKYIWLYSCPAVLRLGRFTHREYRGIVLLPLLYPRINILGEKEKKPVIYNDIPMYMGRDIVEKICLDLVNGVEPSDPVEKAYYMAMHYGGLNTVLLSSNTTPLTIELINTDKYRFYYRRVENNKGVEASLGEWVLLGSSLRTGDTELLLDVCSDLGRVDSGKCLLDIVGGELLITTIEIKNEGYERIVPDNNPLRHVINMY